MSTGKRLLIFAIAIAVVIIVVFYLTRDNNVAQTNPSVASSASEPALIQDPTGENFGFAIYPNASASLDGSATSVSFMDKKFKTVTYSTNDSLDEVLTFYRQPIDGGLVEGKARFAGLDNTIFSQKNSSRSYAIVSSSEGRTKIQLIDQL